MNEKQYTEEELLKFQQDTFKSKYKSSVEELEKKLVEAQKELFAAGDVFSKLREAGIPVVVSQKLKKTIGE